MTTQREDIEAIKQLAQNWRSGWLSSDTDYLLSLYVDEPVLMPDNQPAVMGKEPVREIYQSFFNDFIIECEDRLMEVQVSGDLGYFWMTYKITAIPKSGEDAISDEGKSLFIVERQVDSSWKISRLIDNSSQPQPGCA